MIYPKRALIVFQSAFITRQPYDQKQLGQKKINIILACHSSLLREGRAETQAEPMEEGCFLTCCLESC